MSRTCQATFTEAILSSRPASTAASALPHGQSRIAPAGNLGDLQAGAREARSLGGQLEAEPQRVVHHAGQRADLQPHAGDLRVAHALGHGVHHALDDRELVHRAVSFLVLLALLALLAGWGAD